MCVCLHVDVSVSLCENRCVLLCVHMYVCVCVYACVCMHACVCVCVRVRAHMHVFVYACMYVLIHNCVHITQMMIMSQATFTIYCNHFYCTDLVTG